MLKKLFYFNILFIIIIFSGCSTLIAPTTPQKKVTKIIKITKQNKYTDLEKKLIEIAKENQRSYNEYIEILHSLKDRTKMYDKTKIPKRLARRTSFHYEGPALMLLKNIAEETHYEFNYDKYRVYDTKNIVRNYKDTMLIDIIYDITSSFDFDVKINEKDSTIKLQER